METMSLPIWVLIIIIVAAILFLWLFFTFVPVALWISALAANVRVGILTLVGMRLRRVVPARIVNPPDQGGQSRS
jgi:uncharacterized protein YqfA (UPF0365 family)